MEETTNQSNMTGDISPEHQLTVAIIFQTILFAVVCLVGLVGNTLVIYVVIRFSKMQTVTNMYIVNLAIADECFLIGIPFLIVTMINGHWIFGYVTCKAYMISTSINQFTSSIFLCIMSADRYIAVCHPISSPKWRTPLISRIVSVLAWTCSILLIIPIIKHATEISQPDSGGRMSCIIDWSTHDSAALPATSYPSTTASTITSSTIVMTPTISTNDTGMEQDAASAVMFTTYTFVFSFAIPLVLILVFYCLVIKKLKTVGPKNKSKEKKRSHRKVTNLVLTVVTVYVICWLPYWITQLAQIFSNTPFSKFVITLHLMASCLSYSNSAMNPILYAFLSDNFKKSFLKACTCAAGKDVNATLHLENSVFPRKNRPGSERSRIHNRCTSIANNDEECDMGPLVSKADQSTSVITMTSRTNITSLGDSRETISKNNTTVKNGNMVVVHPTCL